MKLSVLLIRQYFSSDKAVTILGMIMKVFGSVLVFYFFFLKNHSVPPPGIFLFILNLLSANAYLIITFHLYEVFLARRYEHNVIGSTYIFKAIKNLSFGITVFLQGMTNLF